MFQSINSTHIIIAGAVVAFLALISLAMFDSPSTQPTASAAQTELAQCIADSGATFYGAFWCPHCADQKDKFGAAAKQLPYVECSTPDGQGQTQECNEAGVTTYPTWEFADGSRLEGVLSLTRLAEKTECEYGTN